MPHLPPIEINGGSVKVRFPVGEGNDHRIKAHPFDDTEDVVPGPHGNIKLNRFSENDDKARIYLIEIKGGPGSKKRKFAPLADGLCSIKIHYVSGEKPPDKDGDTTPLD